MAVDRNFPFSGHLPPEGFKFIPNRKETTMKKAKEFKERILMQFRNTSKKSWDRKEITRKVMDLWTEFLEKQMEKGRRTL